MPVTRDLSKFSGRLTEDIDSDDSLASVRRSIAASGEKPICDSSDDDDSSSEKKTTKKTGATTRKDLRDTKGLSAEWKTHIEQSDRELTPGCIIMFYLLPPTDVWLEIRWSIYERKKANDCWSKVHWSDGDTRTNAQLTVDFDRRLKSNKIADLKERSMDNNWYHSRRKGLCERFVSYWRLPYV